MHIKLLLDSLFVFLLFTPINALQAELLILGLLALKIRLVSQRLHIDSCLMANQCLLKGYRCCLIFGAKVHGEIYLALSDDLVLGILRIGNQ